MGEGWRQAEISTSPQKQYLEQVVQRTDGQGHEFIKTQTIGNTQEVGSSNTWTGYVIYEFLSQRQYMRVLRIQAKGIQHSLEGNPDKHSH